MTTMKPSQKQKVRRHCMVVCAHYPLGETRVQREAEALVKNGYEVDVICVRGPGNPPRDVYKGVNVYRERYMFLSNLFSPGSIVAKFIRYINFLIMASLRLNWLHLRKHYDSIQVHNLPDFLVFAALLPKLFGVPVILDLHDLMPEFYAGRFQNSKSLPARLILLQERLSCRFANHVITVSEHWRQTLIRRGLPPEKCSVLMNVADESIFHPPAAPRLRAQSNGHSSFRIIYHGSIVERYGLDLAIEAVACVRPQIPGIHLFIVGKGEYVAHLQEMIERLDLRENVTIDRLHVAEELPEMILSCDLGLVPYRNDVFTDSLLPTKLMEYAALGLPAIASRTTAIQAYFKDTNTEFFEPDNVDDLARVILSLYRDPNRMAELACGSAEFNRRYNWADLSREYVSLVGRVGKKK